MLNAAENRPNGSLENSRQKWILVLCFATAALCGARIATEIRYAYASPPSPEAKAIASGNSTSDAAGLAAGPAGSFALKSSAFQAGSDIPAKFSCQGPDISPPLSWADPPSGTQSFALIVDDPDAPAGTWVHWVAYDLPANVHGLPENVPKQRDLSAGGQQGVNSFEKVGYGGPCPPPGNPHRYVFKLYALDTRLNLKPGATKEVIEHAMNGHVLATAELAGRFGR